LKKLKRLGKRKEHDISHLYTCDFHYVDKSGNKIPPEIRFPKVTIQREDGTKITFFDTKNPKKVHELESELYGLQKKTGISSIRRMRSGQPRGIIDAVDRLSMPGPSEAELEFFSLHDELERPEDYRVNVVTRYCGLQVKPEVGYTKKIECPYEYGYCEKCEICKNLKDKVQKQNK